MSKGFARTDSVEKAYTAGSTANTVNIHYGLNTELGFIRNFPVDLEATAIGDELTGLSAHA